MSVSNTEETEPKATRRTWMGLAVLALPTLLVALDMNVLFLALPRLTAELGADSVEQLWITDAYGFMVAGLVITMGTLGDRIGRRKLLLTGAVFFAIASLASAYAPNPTVLIAARTVLGIAGATVMPSTLALITNMFRDGQERGKAIAVWATCNFTGAALGPVVGGILLDHFWWGSVFLMALPIMVVVLIAGPLVLPEFRPPQAGRLDLTSVLLSMLAILPIVYGIKTLATGNGTATVSVVAILVGLVFAIVFVRRQLRLENPLLDLRLFTRRSFALVVLALSLAGIVMAGVGLLVTQFLQSVLGYSPLVSALWFAPMGLAVAVGTMVTPAFTKSLKPSVAIAGGLAVSTLGAAVLIVVNSTWGPVPVVIGIAILAVGTGPLFTIGTGLVVGSVPPERAGSAAAMSETANFLGGALGLALLGTIGAAVYQHQMTGAVPEGVPAAAAETARETVAGASSVAASLPADQAGELLRQAHGAFTAGLNAAGVLSTVIFGLFAVLAAVFFRRAGGEQS
ncbi:MFS transporter [Streptosporangium sp. NPDC020145]|uniref:MFS transporter n=1 Tax=Streptosporangium jomthongense TaxID=1193683 RepID=A0ABV8FDI9_9ACTN